jgi:SAM-dependent methyltransferase
LPGSITRSGRSGVIAPRRSVQVWVLAEASRIGQSVRPTSPETRLRVSLRASRVRAVPENYFDAWVAQRYEVLWPQLFDPKVVEPAVSFLSDLAGDGRALELGIGTGRLALPLSRRGIRVDGIELSAAMVEQLRSQPGSSDIDVTIGDFATTKLTSTFTLAYLVRNTIMNLTTQDAQVECFRNVAAHLDPGGCFVIEVTIPPWQRLAPGETVIPFDVSPTHLGFDEIDVATQNSWSHHYWFVNGETKTFSAPFRYAWPSELDLMARLAGMALRERWSDWNREPFTTESRSHISVWQKAG